MQAVEAPLALGLSGGGDSVALLHEVMDWATQRGRRVLALTVDHRLNPQSADWTRFAGEVARGRGADWQALSWDEAKGGAGVTARARAARHGLLAAAARAAGAKVLMLAHTLDDMAESEVLRGQGSTLGSLREWSPSPVWPEGREVMLFRPMLGERRETLRDALRARAQVWIEDPANADMTYGRSRARASLKGALAGDLAEGPETGKMDLGSLDWGPLDLGALAWGGVFRMKRTLGGRALAFGLVCAGGGDRPPRGDRLEGLMTRLAAGEDFTATLVGARLEAKGDEVWLMREPGEFRRRGLASLALEADQAVVWDGRFEIAVDQPGWQVQAAAGCLGRVEPLRQRWISSLPPAARASLPVLKNTATNQLVMAHEWGRVRELASRRLSLSLGEKTQESDLFASVHGALAATDLFSEKDCDQ